MCRLFRFLTVGAVLQVRACGGEQPLPSAVCCGYCCWLCVSSAMRVAGHLFSCRDVLLQLACQTCRRAPCHRLLTATYRQHDGSCTRKPSVMTSATPQSKCVTCCPTQRFENHDRRCLWLSRCATLCLVTGGGGGCSNGGADGGVDVTVCLLPGETLSLRLPIVT
jgi:hypothetical protein